MKILFEFECNDGHRSEALVEKDTFEIYCRTCGEPAHKVVSRPNFKLEGWSGAFPTRADKWTKEHEKAGEKGRKRRQEEDFYTPSDPNSLF